MAWIEHNGVTSPIHLMWALCGWNKDPSGQEDDCRELLDDPHARLSRGSVEFSSMGTRMYVVWLPLLIVFEIYVFLPLLIMTRRFRLDVDGFHVVQGQKDLLFPWEAANPGRDWNIGFFQITIPVEDHAKDLERFHISCSGIHNA
jgi:hypothetical protein